MMDTWIVIGAVAATNFVVKAAGPLVLGARALPAPLQRLIDASVPALVAALVVVGAFAAGQDLVLDARAGGLAAAIVAVLARAPMLVVLVAAAGATALLRAT